MLYRSNKAYTYIGPLYEAHNDYLLFVRLSQLERERTRIDGSAAHLLPQEKKKNPVVSLRIFFRHLFSLPASSVKAAAGYIRFLPDRASLLQSPRPSLAGNAG
jgi:hypothetical protein